MTERIDHAAEAREYLTAARECPDDAISPADPWLLAAQAHATLALVEQQRIANLIALGQVTIGPDCSPVMLGAVWPGGELRPEIKEGLGL